MKRVISVQFLLWFTLMAGRGQDIHLSQFTNTPLLRNPALAGIFTGDIRLQAVYRNQWQGIGYPYQTSVLGVEYKFPVGGGDDFVTTGISCFYDVAGIVRLRTLQVMPVLNFHKSLSSEKNRYLSAGFMGGFVQRQFDGMHLTFDNQYRAGRFDPAASSGERFSGMRRSFPDFAAGLSYNSAFGENGNYFLGASLWHFNKPKANFLDAYIQLEPKWQFHGGIRTYISEQVILHAEANHLRQGAYDETVGGAMLYYSLTEMLPYADSRISELQLGAGLFTRLRDAIIPQVSIVYNHFDIGLSYDINISRLTVATSGRGGYELSLSYRAFANNNQVRYMRCPKF